MVSVHVLIVGSLLSSLGQWSQQWPTGGADSAIERGACGEGEHDGHGKGQGSMGIEGKGAA